MFSFRSPSWFVSFRTLCYSCFSDCISYFQLTLIFAPLVCIVVVYAFTKDKVDATQAFLGEFAAAMFVYDFNCN